MINLRARIKSQTYDKIIFVLMQSIKYINMKENHSKNAQTQKYKAQTYDLNYTTITIRNGKFAGFPGHPPRPAPIGTGIGTCQSGMGRVWGFLKNPNRVRGGVGCSYNLTRPAPNMKLPLYPPLINISFLSSFQVFFSPSQFSFLSTLGFFLHQSRFILVYPIFTRNQESHLLSSRIYKPVRFFVDFLVE